MLLDKLACISFIIEHCDKGKTNSICEKCEKNYYLFNLT